MADPINTVPGAQSVAEDTILPIAGVLVADVDSSALVTTLSVANGTLNVTAGAGVTGNGTTEVEIVGTAAEINAALAGLSYTGNLNFNGSDTLTVLTNDGVLTDTDTIAITVTPVNDEPTANADTASVAANAMVTGNVLTNDTDPDQDLLNVSSVDQGVNLVGQSIAGKYGTLILNADGSYTYTANNSAPAGAPVTDTFTYTVTDQHGGSDALFVNFEAPYVLGSINGQQGWTVTGPFDQSVVADGPDQGLHFTRQVTSGSFGNQLFSPALTQIAGEASAPGAITSFFEASWTMTPQALETSADAQNSFIGISMDHETGTRGNLLRLVNDASGNWVLHALDFSQGDFTDTVVAPLPVGVATTIGFTQQFVDGPGNDVWKVYVNDQLLFTGTGWEDFNVGGSLPVSYEQLLFRASGDAVIGDQGVIIDNVSFTTNQQSTLTVSVQGNNAPVNTVPGAQTVDEDTALLIAGVLVADDSPTLTTTLTVLSGTLNVTAGAGVTGNGTTEVEIVGTAAEINAALAGLSYTGNLNFNGSDTLTVLTNDGVLTDTDTIAITVTPVNDEPTANADTASVAANAMVTGNVLTNDTDPDQDLLNVSSVDQGVNLVGQSIAGKYGTLILNADGSYTYTANNSAPAGAPVTDTFTYTVTDQHGGSDALFVNFEAPYVLGSINGQQGWTVTGPFDQSVVADGPDQGLHFTRQVTSGSFGNQLFSPALTQIAGEASAPGAITSFFEASWTMTPQALETSADAQNSFIGISMDHETGTRGNLLRLVNDASGNWVLHALDFSQDDFTDTVVAPLPVGVATTIGFTQQFVDGPGNDVWKVYVNDQLLFTGTGWEDFNVGGSLPVSYEQLLFRASGDAVIGDQGVIIDNVSFTTNQQSTLTVSVQGNNAPAEHAHCDFDGDSGSDILWQDNNGTASMWLMDGTNATFVGAVGTNPGPTWHIEGTGDFNGDGKADIIWQGDNGTASMWLMDGHDATFVGAVGTNPGPTWHIEGTGDFNGDGKDDIIWQGDDGTASMWLMDGTNATFVGAVGPFNPGPSWHIEGTGDFNGDGKADIIWQGDDGTASMWLMDGTNATFVGAVGPFNPGPSWHIEGTGDFNGDGKSDIIWQGDDGTASMWLMDGTNATFVGAVGPFNPGPTWHIKGTGDFNGDGKSDIVWQGDDGTASIWLMDGSNATNVGAVGPFNPGATWDMIA